MNMPKQHAAAFLRSISTDYAEQMRRQGHKQAAELMKANAAAAIHSLTAEGSSQAVPDANDQD